MSGDRLREAAARLREVAEAATPGPWHVAKSGHIDAGEYDTVIGRGPVDCMAYCYGGSSTIEGDRLEADSTYIATMSPPVALALADWLDAEYVTQAEMEPLADLINASFTAVSGVEAGVIEFGRDPAGNIQYRANTFVGALAVADAILGGDR